jgi:hypothetical protein
MLRITIRVANTQGGPRRNFVLFRPPLPAFHLRLQVRAIPLALQYIRALLNSTEPLHNTKDCPT